MIAGAAYAQSSSDLLSGLAGRLAKSVTTQSLTVSGTSALGTVASGDVSAALATPTGATTARTVAAHFADVIYARDRGVKCDNSTDDASAINAISSTALNNAVIVFPPGICKFSGTLNFNLINSAVYGAGPGATTLTYTGASTTSDLVVLSGAGSTAEQNSVFQGIKILSSTTMTAGSALHVIKASYMTLRDLSTGEEVPTDVGKLYNGVYIDQPNMVTVDGLVSRVSNDALRTAALGITTNYQYDVFIHHAKLAESAVGLHVGGGIDNVHVSDSEITSNTVNVLDDNAIQPYKNQEIYLDSGTVLDQATNYNLQINDADCNIANYGVVSVYGPVTGAKNYDGIYVQNFPSCQLVVNAPLIANNARDGIRFDDGSAKLFLGPTVIANNGEYGILSNFAYTNFNGTGATQIYGNTAGNTNALVTLPALNVSNVTATGNISTATGVGALPVYGATGIGSPGAHIVTGQVTLSSGSGAASFSGAAVFANNSYGCTAADNTTVAAVKVSPAGTSTVNFSGSGSDLISYACIGR
ncbi:hypothetical protein A8D80_35880 [Burkholderia cenocepacia]|nr:hypothetical protein A8D80_35880 [Burkholderia cenocepacia]